MAMNKGQFHKRKRILHPTHRLGFLARNDTLCLSIIVTNRCNLRCSYCHYCSRISPQLRNADIEDTVFDRYLTLIDWIKSHLHRNVQVRFSGGEPLVLGERLYQLADRASRRLGVGVHVLTNGALLNSAVVRSAAECGISAFLASIENPFDIDKGSISPTVVLNNIGTLASTSVAILPAVVIVRNHLFSRLPELADYFFDRIGVVPTISEMNFGAYVPPTQPELRQLREAVKVVVTKYVGRSPLVLFPYIVPELAYCFENRYLLEFGLVPRRSNFLSCSIDECVTEVVRCLANAYPRVNCRRYECAWHHNCRRAKWLWLSKMPDYCAFKRAISQGYYEAITRN